MIILDIIISFICAACASLGIGGGGLLVVYLSAIKNLTQKEAQSLNLIFFVLSMSITLVYHKCKNRIITKNLPLILLPCLMGGIAGSLAAKATDQNLLKILFGSFMILGGLKFLLSQNTK